MNAAAGPSGWLGLANGSEPDDALDEPCDILIVDDLPEKLLVFRTVLEDLGQNLVFVNSGKEALREVLKREFAVILLDVNMPELDGFETAEMIRKYQRSAHTPIIFITSYADEVQTARGYSIGAVDYILSPVVPEILRSKVKVFVSLYAMQRQVRRQGIARAEVMAAEAARHAAEHNDRRSAFLAQASRVLAGTLEVTVGMRQLAEIVVPALASCAAVVLVDEPGEPGDALLAAMAPGATTPMLVSSPTTALVPALLAPLNRAMKELHGRVLSDSERDALDTRAFGPSAGEPPLRLRCVIVVPLVIGDRVHGALLAADAMRECADGDGDGRNDDGRLELDRSVLEDLASRAAVAFENARLYRSLQGEIVERTAAQAELQAANQRKDEFLAMLSHELRNPLAPIRTALEVLQRIAPPDPKFKWATDIMRRQLRQLTHLTEELLDVARISQGKIVLAHEPVDLNAVVAQSVESARPGADAHRQTLSVALSAQPLWLQGDFARLTQIVSNLLNNASKYSGKDTAIEVATHLEDSGAVIAVRDHGIGIDADLLPRVFDLFAQGQRGLDRSQGGLGIGLTLAQRLAQMHGGRIVASSAGVDQGAEFRLHLPCDGSLQGRDRTGPAPAHAAATAISGAARRVLIVDDNVDGAKTIQVLLQFAGHEVETAADGEQALASAARFEPDVVILDIGLPLLDGYEVARRLRQMPALRRALLIALTGYGQKEDREAAMAAGFDEHYVKPADPQKLTGRIARWARPGDTAAAFGSHDAPHFNDSTSAT